MCRFSVRQQPTRQHAPRSHEPPAPSNFIRLHYNTDNHRHGNRSTFSPSRRSLSSIHRRQCTVNYDIVQYNTVSCNNPNKTVDQRDNRKHPQRISHSQQKVSHTYNKKCLVHQQQKTHSAIQPCKRINYHSNEFRQHPSFLSHIGLSGTHSLRR